MQKGWKSQFFANASTNDYDYANVAITYIYTYILRMLDNYFRMNQLGSLYIEENPILYFQIDKENDNNIIMVRENIIFFM